MLSWFLTDLRTKCIDDSILKHIYKWEDLLIDKAPQDPNLRSIKDLNNIVKPLHMAIYWLKVQLLVLVWVWRVLQLVLYLPLKPNNPKISTHLLRVQVTLNLTLVCMKTKYLRNVWDKTPLTYHNVNYIWIL
jgi:hypothetical protein